MGPVLLAVGGFFCGAILVYFVSESRRKRVEDLDRQLRRLKVQLEDESERLETEEKRIASMRRTIEIEQSLFTTRQQEFNRKAITYEELEQENRILKTDLRNQVIASAKLAHDMKEQRIWQKQIDDKANELGRRYLKETRKWVERSLTQNNYASNKTRLEEAIAWCRAIGVEISKNEERVLLEELKKQFELAVRAAVEREEQARIRAQMREELKREKEIQDEIERAEREKRAVQVALDRAMREADGRHSVEIARLQAQLAEAEAKSQRAISQAQLTKAGTVYVISNIGSFGVGVFKIGMTRRLEPMDRVIELGDASVPFPFDVHMMIATDNAPELEKALHRAFYKQQINKVNPRKEFFRTTIDEIVKVVKANHGEVEYTADAEALQYYESLNTDPDEQAVIEEAFEKATAGRMHGEYELDD